MAAPARWLRRKAGLLAMLFIGAAPIGVARGAERLQIPGFAEDGRGNFVVVWQGEAARGGGHGIVARRFHRQGSARGPGFHVNTITAGTQRDAAVAMERGGNFLVIWAGDRLDGRGAGVYGQRYHRDGSVRGGEFQVNAQRIGEGSAPGITADPGGGFLVTWPSGACVGQLGRRYDAAGLPVGVEFVVAPCAPPG